MPGSPGSQAQLPPGGAQQPETKQRRWGLGSKGNVLFQQSSLPTRGGWGRCQDPQLQPPPREAPRQLRSLKAREQWKQEGRKEGGGPRQTKALQAPPQASLPSSRCCSLTPLSPPRRLSTISHGGKGRWQGGGVWGQSCHSPTQDCGPTFPQMPQQIGHAKPPQDVGLSS